MFYNGEMLLERLEELEKILPYIETEKQKECIIHEIEKIKDIFDKYLI